MERRRRTVLITGASSGIGKSTARLFADEGFRVFGTSRQSRADDDGIEMLQLDVRSDESVSSCIAEVLSRAGGIDILVNNAGVWEIGVAEETPAATARDLFEVNFFGVDRMIRSVLPVMRAQRASRIINIGSLAAWIGEPGEAFYSASKHALAGYTESLRQEVWPLRIHVSLIEPGAFKTGLADTSAGSGITLADYDSIRSAILRTLQEAVQAGDDPSKVARTVLKVARARAPRLRYGIGHQSRWIPYIRTLLPQRLLDVLLRRGFGLVKQRSGTA